MRFLRTATTGRLLAVIGGVVAAIVVGAAVAVAATSGGPVPKRQPLASAIHQALKAPAISGISARVSFTNNLIDSAELQGSDPLLQGGTGRLWMSSATHQLRLEVQGSNGDAQVVVHGSSFWMYDPSSQTVYEGRLPAQQASRRRSVPSGKGWTRYAPLQRKGEQLPSVAQIQSGLGRLMRHVQLSRAIPGDVAGQPAYTVHVSPKQGGGMLRGLELAWDAVRGVPLRFEVLARGDSTPVLELTATDISFGKVASSTFAISPPSGAKVVHLFGASGVRVKHHARSSAKRQEATGVAAVSRALPFKLAAPSSAAGMHRSTVTLLHGGSHPVALVTYGQGLGAVAVVEGVSSGRSSALGGMSGGGSDGQGLSVPTVSIDGTTGQELDTALGTVIQFTRDHVAYTVLGSVHPAVARELARSL